MGYGPRIPGLDNRGRAAVSDVLSAYRHPRSVTLYGLHTNHAGTGGANLANGVAAQYIGSSPVTSTDRSQLTFAGCGGVPTYASAGSANQPFVICWRGSMLENPGDLTYGLFYGDGGNTNELAAKGFGVRFTSNSAFDLCVHNGSTTTNIPGTYNNFIATGTVPNRQVIILEWTGTALSLYLAAAPQGSELPEPVLAASTEVTVTGDTTTSAWRFGIYGTGSANWTVQPSMITFSVNINEALP